MGGPSSCPNPNFRENDLAHRGLVLSIHGAAQLLFPKEALSMTSIGSRERSVLG